MTLDPAASDRDGVTPGLHGGVAVVVVGGGQAGLSVAACLQERGVRPLVLERHRIAHAWENQRWDSFCLVTPNWQCRLPGFPYQGPEPGGFMGREQIVDYVRAFARKVAPAVREGVEVRRLQPGRNGFRLDTSAGELQAEQVVVATGAYHRPRRPPLAQELPPSLLQIDAFDYRSPERLPRGSVLVVGSGQSGCQIAEDLFLAGRRVHLSVGSAPRSPRRYRGRDVVEWLERMGHYTTPIEQMDDPAAVRRKTNHYLTGRDGGREIDLRRRAQQGMVLHGRLAGLEGGRIRFADDLVANLDNADAVHERIRAGIDAFIEREGITAPEEPPGEPCTLPVGTGVPLGPAVEDLAAVIWCTGYSSDFGWIDADVFDADGQPLHRRGITGRAGLYFLGLPWLHTWGSGRFGGIAADAAHLAEAVLERQAARAASLSCC